MFRVIDAPAGGACGRASSRGTAEEILDLAEDVDPERDHIRGPDDAPVTLVEYGDFECPYCGQAEAVIRELLDSFGDDLRYVWRHLPLNDVHPNAQLAAEAAEAAGAQGAFWEMHDLLLDHQDELGPRELARTPSELGLDVDRFWEELRRARARAARRRGRRRRGRERRRRHADVLHQRPPPRGRLRRRDADARGAHGARPRARLSAARRPRGPLARRGPPPARWPPALCPGPFAGSRTAAG